MLSVLYRSPLAVRLSSTDCPVTRLMAFKIKHNGNDIMNIYILLVDDVTLTVYKVMSSNIRSPLMKTLGRSVETLGRECNFNYNYPDFAIALIF